MSDVTAQPHEASFSDVLAWEAGQDAKHEFANGAIVAFAGGPLAHHSLVGDISSLVAESVLPTRWRALGSALLVPTAAGARYPDVSVACDQPDLADPSAREWVAAVPVSSGRLRLESVAAELDLDLLDDRAGVAAAWPAPGAAHGQPPAPS